MTTALEGGEGSASRPGRSLPPGKTRYPLYRRLGGAQGRSGQVRKISPPPAFDPQTGQPDRLRYPARSRLNAKSNIPRLRTILFICFMHLLFSVSAKEPHFLSSCVSYGYIFFLFSRNRCLGFSWKHRSKSSLLSSKPTICVVFAIRFYVHVLTF
jgi:hypothetical protein